MQTTSMKNLLSDYNKLKIEFLKLSEECINDASSEGYKCFPPFDMENLSEDFKYSPEFIKIYLKYDLEISEKTDYLISVFNYYNAKEPNNEPYFIYLLDNYWDSLSYRVVNKFYHSSIIQDNEGFKNLFYNKFIKKLLNTIDKYLYYTTLYTMHESLDKDMVKTILKLRIDKFVDFDKYNHDKLWIGFSEEFVTELIFDKDTLPDNKVTQWLLKRTYRQLSEETISKILLHDEEELNRIDGNLFLNKDFFTDPDFTLNDNDSYHLEGIMRNLQYLHTPLMKNTDLMINYKLVFLKSCITYCEKHKLIKNLNRFEILEFMYSR